PARAHWPHAYAPVVAPARGGHRRALLRHPRVPRRPAQVGRRSRAGPQHRPGSCGARRLLVRPDHAPVMTQIDLAFPSMGGEARVRLESVLYDEAELTALADGIHTQIEAVEAALSRFDPDSELSRLNRDPRPAVPASPLLRRAVAAALWAAEASDGLVDATLLGEL